MQLADEMTCFRKYLRGILQLFRIILRFHIHLIQDTSNFAVWIRISQKNKGISNARFLLGRLRTTIKNKNRSSKDVLIPVRITGFDGWTDELILFESNTSSMQINILFRNRCNQIDTSMTFDICHTCDSPWTINERHCWHIVVPHSILYLHAQFSLRLIFKSFFYSQ